MRTFGNVLSDSYGIEKVFATDALMKILIRESVAYMSQNKESMQSPENSKSDSYQMIYYRAFHFFGLFSFHRVPVPLNYSNFNDHQNRAIDPLYLK
jgi:hypothetical protein